jgi:hypothetical protein
MAAAEDWEVIDLERFCFLQGHKAALQALVEDEFAGGQQSVPRERQAKGTASLPQYIRGLIE